MRTLSPVAAERMRRLLRGQLYLGSRPGQVSMSGPFASRTESCPIPPPPFAAPGERTKREPARDLHLDPDLRLRHLYIIGKSGFGKTTLIRNLVQQDLIAGHGLAVVAPEEDLFSRQILPLVPKHRRQDVVYINPRDTTRPIPLNPLVVQPGEDFDLKLDETLSAFLRLFADEATVSAPRMESILGYTLATLMRVPGATLDDIERLLDRQDPGYRLEIASGVSDESCRRFWTSTYSAMPKDAHLSLLNRLSRFLRPRFVRALLCTPGASFNFREAMDSGKVVLISLPDGLIGPRNAQVIGQLVVTRLQLAAMSRADIAEEARRPFYVYIDEFENFCGAAVESYKAMFSRTRKYRVPLTIAHQQLGQVGEPLMREILGTVSTIVAFRVSASDARRLSRELIDASATRFGGLMGVDPGTLVLLPRGRAYARLEDQVLQVVTPPPPRGGTAEVADEVIRRSRDLYGVGAGQKGSKTSSVAEISDPLSAIDPADVFGA